MEHMQKSPISGTPDLTRSAPDASTDAPQAWLNMDFFSGNEGMLNSATLMQSAASTGGPSAATSAAPAAPVAPLPQQQPSAPPAHAYPARPPLLASVTSPAGAGMLAGGSGMLAGTSFAQPIRSPHSFAQPTRSPSYAARSPRPPATPATPAEPRARHFHNHSLLKGTLVASLINSNVAYSHFRLFNDKFLSSHEFAFHADLTNAFFAPAGVVRYDLFDRKSKIIKSFELANAVIPRFQRLVQQAGAVRTSFNLHDIPDEYILNNTDPLTGKMTTVGFMLRSQHAVWTFFYATGIRVDIVGTLVLQLVIVPNTHLEQHDAGTPLSPTVVEVCQLLRSMGTSVGLDSALCLKIDNIQFTSKGHEEYINRGAVLQQGVDIVYDTAHDTLDFAPPPPESSPALAQEEKARLRRLRVMRDYIPFSPIGRFGLPESCMRCLELSHNMAQMGELIDVTAGSHSSALDMLGDYKKQLGAFPIPQGPAPVPASGAGPGPPPFSGPFPSPGQAAFSSPGQGPFPSPSQASFPAQPSSFPRPPGKMAPDPRASLVRSATMPLMHAYGAPQNFVSGQASFIPGQQAYNSVQGFANQQAQAQAQQQQQQQQQHQHQHQQQQQQHVQHPQTQHPQTHTQNYAVGQAVYANHPNGTSHTPGHTPSHTPSQSAAPNPGTVDINSIMGQTNGGIMYSG